MDRMWHIQSDTVQQQLLVLYDFHMVRAQAPGPGPRRVQNENMAAFFLVPNIYTSAWLMKSPTVMPIVTAIMALPISIPFPDAAIAPPPACERPDLEYEKKGQLRLRFGEGATQHVQGPRRAHP